jgi:hypothetical protein
VLDFVNPEFFAAFFFGLADSDFSALQTVRIVIDRARRRLPMIAALASFLPFYAPASVSCQNPKSAPMLSR